jgi:basic membrane protein A
VSVRGSLRLVCVGDLPAGLALALCGPYARTMRAKRLVTLLLVSLTLLGIAASDVIAGHEQDRARVVLVTHGCSGATSICDPFTRAAQRTRVNARMYSPAMLEDPVGTLSLLAASGYDLVIVDTTYVGALSIVAPRFPKTRFAVLDAPLSSLSGPHRNVEAMVNEPNEAAYLAGWLAAKMEQRRAAEHVVGVVGGVHIPQVDDFIVGFRAGAYAADSSIEILTGYSHDFVDPNKCEAIAQSQIASGAGAIFDVAGFCGLGALRAAKAAGVWGIGVDSDQSGLGPFILTSVVKEYEAGLEKLFGQARDGTIRTGVTTVLGLRQGGAGLGRISPKVPVSLRAGLARVRARIIAGAIHVPLAPR